MDRLKEKGRHFREAFLAKLALLLRGTVAAPPERFGETLADEHIRGGADAAALPLNAYLLHHTQTIGGRPRVCMHIDLLKLQSLIPISSSRAIYFKSIRQGNRSADAWTC